MIIILTNTLFIEQNVCILSGVNVNVGVGFFIAGFISYFSPSHHRIRLHYQTVTCQLPLLYSFCLGTWQLLFICVLKADFDYIMTPLQEIKFNL